MESFEWKEQGSFHTKWYLKNTAVIKTYSVVSFREMYIFHVLKEPYRVTLIKKGGWGEDSLYWKLAHSKVQVNPKGNQLWRFTGRTDAEAPILWPPSVMSWLIGKDPDAGKDWGQEKGTTGWDGGMASPTQWTCCSVVSDSLWPRELQHTRLPCPSLPFWVCSKFEAWHAAVLGVTKNQTWLSGQTTSLELFFSLFFCLRSYTL